MVAREEEDSTSPTPEGRRISPTRLDMGVGDPSTSARKETRYEEGSSSEQSPEPRGRGITPGGILERRSSSQGSRFREHDL